MASSSILNQGLRSPVNGRQQSWKLPFLLPRYLAGSLTSDEEVASHDKHQANGGQHEASTVAVVLVAHETDATHGVSIYLEQDGSEGKLVPALLSSSSLSAGPPTTHYTWATARIATVRTKGSDHVSRWK